MKRLYLVGFDSVPLWILKDLRHEKGLEIFDKLLSESLFTEMESTLPPMSGPAWPSIYTGLEPSEHGIPDFFIMKKNYTPDIIVFDSAAPTLWGKLSKYGKKSLLITPVEETSPNEPKNVDIITGFPLPAKTNNAKLRALMKKYKFEGEPDIEKYIKSGKMTEAEGIKIFVESIKKRAEIAKESLKQDYDFIFTCFTETDRMQHFLLNKNYWKEYLKPIYVEYAKFLEFLIKRVDEENSALIIVSDHGSQPIKNKFLMNAWLVNNGYLKIKDAVMSTIESSSTGKESVLYSIREKMLKTRLRRFYDKLPHGMKRIAFDVLGSIFQGASSGTYTRLHLFDFDMANSKVFAAISNDPVTTLWINDERFANPTVSKREKEKVKQELIKKLKSVKNREGRPMFTSIVDGNKYYGNTDKFIAPDLLVEASEGYTLDIFNYSKKTDFMKPENAKGGDHSRYGIFGYYPKSLNIDTKGIKVTDVYSIILGYFGITKSKRVKFLK